MALIKSAVLSAISGSIGGTTFARNRAGSYARNRSIPVNPNSTGQISARTTMANLVSAWATELTAAQRAAWDSYAAAIPWLNRVGETTYLTGQNHYIRSNAARLAHGLTRIDPGPTTLTSPAGTDVTISAVDTVADVGIGFDDSDTWASEDGAALLVQISREVTPTTNFFKGPWRVLTAVEGDSVTPPTSPDSVTDPFGVHNSGNKLFIRYAFTRADGRLSYPRIASAVVT